MSLAHQSSRKPTVKEDYSKDQKTLIQFGVCYGVEQVMMMSVLLVLSWC
jgi:hypothetical protein